MHKLTRQDSLRPAFLDQYKRANAPWEELAYHHHDDHYLPLCRVLAEQQEGRCAYCECTVDPEEKGKRHIDHFIRRELRPDLTFSWTNLTLSCENDACCGRCKDKQENKDKPCLDPYATDGRRYLGFSLNSHLCVAHVKSGLSENDKLLAENTICVYGLNALSLCKRRGDRVRAIVDSLLCDYFEGIEQSEDLRLLFKDELEDLIQQSVDGEFCSACIDALTPYMVRMGFRPEEVVFDRHFSPTAVAH